MRNSDWFDTIQDYTERLVRIRSVSPGPGEIEVAREVLRLLHANGMADRYTVSGLDPIEEDLFGRQTPMHFSREKAPPRWCC